MPSETSPGFPRKLSGSSQLSSLERLAQRIAEGILSPDPAEVYAEYRRDPVAYSREVLGVEWWCKQVEIAEAVTKHPRVLVRAGHGTGKDHVAGGLVNWWYDCFDPGLCLTTAPTEEQVIKVLWGEVRQQRAGREGLMPKAPEIYGHAKHYAVGYTARDSNAFQGRHEERVFVIFDEAGGVATIFFDGAIGMLTGPECRWLCILNPLDTSCRMYEEELKGGWHVITVSCLDHPNIAAELRREPPPFPKAVRLSYVLQALADWCTPISPADTDERDIEFPAGSGEWYRPGPLFESRVLGRWPSQSEDSVWSEALWARAQKLLPIPRDQPLQIGCDVARFGSDFTVIIARRGAAVVHHERHNGWSTARTAGRLKELCGSLAFECEDPREVLCTIDDDGVGGGVVDQARGYRFCPVSAGSRAIEEEKYPNRRSELWFSTAQRAREGRVDLTRLPGPGLAELRRQLMAPKWKLDSDGRRVVEPKDKMKQRLGYSPDDADALNLAFAPSTEKEFDLW
jgi:hypothetical protein